VRTPRDSFEPVRIAARSLGDVEATTKYDGSPVLKTGGCFLAGLATHPSAEAGTLVVRADLEQRDHLLEDAPQIYYLTEYYRPHPVVLARLARLDRQSLRDLLAASWRLTLPKTSQRRRATVLSGRLT